MSCKPKVQDEIIIGNSQSETDSIWVYQWMTNKLLGKTNIQKDNTINLPIDKAQVVQIKSSLQEFNSLMIAVPNQSKRIEILENKILLKAPEDSLLSYLQKSTNEFIAQNYESIGSADSSQTVLDKLTKLKKEQSEKIDRSGIDQDLKELLYTQSTFKINNLLFYYGRVMHGISPKDPFYNFIDQIKLKGPMVKQMPQLILYSLEVLYLQKNDSLQNIQSFLNFMKDHSLEKEEEEFLKAFYIKELLESPSYWKKHNQLFNSIELKRLIQSESNNPYKYLFQEAANSYFSALEGNPAFNFQGIKLDSTSISLSSLKNKWVVVDTWATWCGPCIKEKPMFQELANYFNDKDIVFLSVSVDEFYKNWLRYFKTNKPSTNIPEVFLGENRLEFKEAFNIQSIPRYILINKSGEIVDADMERPDEGMKERLESIL
ncbi:MAG: TlpA disulfide reductase family protein [Nitrososphaeraceae archaeon]|nr:TlpA disulfide reductase family protein [Nitrososphaeraceae archaeon]